MSDISLIYCRGIFAEKSLVKHSKRGNEYEYVLYEKT